MSHRRLVQPRRPIFVGTEGEGERVLAKFLQVRCDEGGLRVHLDVRPGTGGDSVTVVKEAHRRLERLPSRREFVHKLVLLDRDRVDQDLAAGHDARVLATRYQLELIFQEPNLEGLLLRLHPGQEQRRVAAASAKRELRSVWPDYDKTPSVDQMQRRFKLEDVRRAARHDPQLRRLLDILGL